MRYRVPPDPVTVPAPPVGGQDIAPPLESLLQDLLILQTPADAQANGPLAGSGQSVAIIESTATALAKWWAAAIGALGGTTAVAAAVTHFWDSQTGGTRIAFVASTAGVIAAALIALAIIIGSDVRGRALGATGVYAARAEVTVAFFDLLCCTSKGDTAPVSPASVVQPAFALTPEIDEQIRRANDEKEANLITQQEYDAVKKKLLQV